MHIDRARGLAIVAGLLIALAPVLPGGPAAAAAGQPDTFYVQGGHGYEACPDGYLCIYDDVQWNTKGGFPSKEPKSATGGSMWATKVSDPNLNGMSDRASSLINNTGRRVTIYQDHKFSGHSFTTTARRRTAYTTLGQAPTGKADQVPYGPEATFNWNDQITSVKIN